MKRYAIKNTITGKYLSTKPSWRPRTWVSLKNAALWVHPGHATQAAQHSEAVKTALLETGHDGKYRSWSQQTVKRVEFEMFLIDSKVGTLTAADLSNQKDS